MADNSSFLSPEDQMPESVSNAERLFHLGLSSKAAEFNDDVESLLRFNKEACDLIAEISAVETRVKTAYEKLMALTPIGTIAPSVLRVLLEAIETLAPIAAPKGNGDGK